MRGNRLRKLIDAPDPEEAEQKAAAAAAAAAATAMANAQKHHKAPATPKRRWNGETRCSSSRRCASVRKRHALLQALAGWNPHLLPRDRPPLMGNALPPLQRRQRHLQRRRLQQKHATAKLLHTRTWGGICIIWMSGTTTWPISPKV
jgi:hypothetical protein